MQSLTIDMEDPEAAMWFSLSPVAQKLITERALHAVLTGRIFPAGSDKIALAIDLAEAGVEAETISALTHLDREIFEGFMPK